MDAGWDRSSGASVDREFNTKEPYALAFDRFCPARRGKFFRGGGLRGPHLSNHSIEAKFYANAGAADWTFGGLYNRIPGTAP